MSMSWKDTVGFQKGLVLGAPSFLQPSDTPLFKYLCNIIVSTLVLGLLLIFLAARQDATKFRSTMEAHHAGEALPNILACACLCVCVCVHM